jgi:cellulose synthase (UDP-forming)
MPLTPPLDRTSFVEGRASKKLLFFNCVLALVYFVGITFFFDHGNWILFSLLIAGEVFHLFQIYGYMATVWSPDVKGRFDKDFDKPVDIYVTVTGEPKETVRETITAILAMDYPGEFHTYILNDGFVADRPNWEEAEDLAKEMGVHCITRQVPGGAKAGNINNALSITKSPYFVVFDADHVPHPQFLREVMGYFVDKKMGFVQTPQFYKNQYDNLITMTAWMQQTLFFGPIMLGKNRLNSAFMCGTNMAISRKAILQAGGMCETSIAEDFLSSLFVHAKGWKSIYIPKVLAEGLAPEDFLSYYKQQFRWARGSLEVIFRHNPFFMKGLSWTQRFQYVTSASYYLSGIVVLIDALLPLFYLYFGLTAVTTSTMALAMIFLPYIFINLYTLQKTSNFTYTFYAIAFSLSSFFMQIRAVISVLTKQKVKFAVTGQQVFEGNFLYLVIPHIIYAALVVVGIAYAFWRDGTNASLLSNAAWAIVNLAVFLPFIYAASPSRKARKAKRKARKNKAVVEGAVS